MPIKKPINFTHHINLDERGSYSADVRNDKEQTVFVIKSGNELEEGESDIFQDGLMKHKGDMEGLKNCLIALGVMTAKDVLTDCK